MILKVVAPETCVCCEWAELLWYCSLTKTKETNVEFGRKYGELVVLASVDF